MFLWKSDNVYLSLARLVRSALYAGSIFINPLFFSLDE